MTASNDLGRVREALLAWYASARRDFPWRGTHDPYAVLVSEVMLQQTQASRVADRFPRFMARFPDIAALAAAAPADVLAAWSGLGYNRRALALQRAAAHIQRDGWPSSVFELERLPGIGAYTARAIASLAFGQPVGVVDTNVRRWLLRRFGGDDQPQRLQSLADSLAAAAGEGSAASSWTHATMEFGAMVCRSREPRCAECPIAAGCPSRGARSVVAVRRQAALRGSDRAYRGALVRELTRAEPHEMPERMARERLDAATLRLGPVLADADWQRIVSRLEHDGLLHRRGGILRLGAATIPR